MTNNFTSDITQFAASRDAEFGFAAKHGGSIDIVAGSDKAASAAMQMLGSLNLAHIKPIAQEVGRNALVAGAASMAVLGDLHPVAIAIGGISGVASIVSKGSPRSKA